MNEQQRAMRIGIDYRLISDSLTVNRGMGRYSQQQLRAVLKHDKVNQYYLYCWEDADPSLILPEIFNSANVSIVRDLPLQSRTLDLQNTLKHSEEFQQFLYRDHIDVFHWMTPFLYDRPPLTTFNVCKLVTSHYDLIPLIYYDQYLKGSSLEEIYHLTLDVVCQSDVLIAISDAVRQEAVHRLKFAEDRIQIAYPIADPCFRMLSEVEVNAQLKQLNARLAKKIPEHFIFCVSATHYTKNLETLLEAYSLLPQTLRKRLPLVLTFAVTEHERKIVNLLAQQFGITDEIILTGFVSEIELVTLYNAALMLIHPSRYEGFGLPVLEAMICGTPVITTNAASLPEVVGTAGILLDPEDAVNMASAIERLYHNPSLRESMKAAGVAQAHQFSEDKLGLATLQAYLQAEQVSIGKSSAEDRTRIALWTPVPPQQTGIADYSVFVLEASKDFDVEVFVDDGVLPQAQLLRNFTIQHYSAYDRRQKQQSFQQNVYQLGASFYHNYILRQALTVPGIVALHDLAMSNLYYGYLMGFENNLEAWKTILLALEGQEAVDDFDALWPPKDDAVILEFFSRYFMLQTLVERSLAIIVHSEDAKHQLDKRYPNGRTFVVHHGTSDPWQSISKNERSHYRTMLRTQYDFTEETFVVGVFGIVHLTKQVHLVLEAVARLAAKHHTVRLMIVGYIPSEVYGEQLRQMAKTLQIDSIVEFTGLVSWDEFNARLITCDVLVNLRHPSMGQMSGTLIRGIATGMPVIISNVSAWNFLPDDICPRVQTGTADALMQLTAHLDRLLNDVPSRKRLSSAARDYYLSDGTADLMTARYKQVIDAVLISKIELPLIFVSDPFRYFDPHKVKTPVVDHDRNHRIMENLRSQLRSMRDLFEAWDAIRLRDLRRIFSQVPVLSFIVKTVVRVRNLGRLWGAQMYLYETFLQHQQSVVNTLGQLDIQSQRLQAQAEQTASIFGQFENRLMTGSQDFDIRVQALERDSNVRLASLEFQLKAVERVYDENLSTYGNQIDTLRQELETRTTTYGNQIDTLRQELETRTTTYGNQIDTLRQELEARATELSGIVENLNVKIASRLDAHDGAFRELLQGIETDFAARINDIVAQLSSILNALHYLQTNTQIVEGILATVQHDLDEQRNTIQNDILNVENKIHAHIDKFDVQTRVMSNRLNSTDAQQSHMLNAHRLQTSYIRLFEDRLKANLDSTAPDLGRGGIVIRLIQQLEREVDWLKNKYKTYVSIQNSRANWLMDELTQYLGDRREITQPEIWYHIDFHQDWYYPNLLHNAHVKLGQDGVFVVLALVPETIPVDFEHPCLVWSHVFTPSPNTLIHVFMFTGLNKLDVTAQG